MGIEILYKNLVTKNGFESVIDMAFNDLSKHRISEVERILSIVAKSEFSDDAFTYIGNKIKGAKNDEYLKYLWKSIFEKYSEKYLDSL
ncbi:MAG: hypothetical protein QW051_03190 [Candidatus Aenigmatarchaeota archaeon]